jgi:hypothetical protein
MHQCVLFCKSPAEIVPARNRRSSFPGFGRALLILCGLVLLAAAGEAATEFRVESQQVAAGAELLTVFGELPELESGENGTAERVRDVEVPLVAILRDTLGDSDSSNDRLRYVWVLTSARPGLLKRASAALPFFYFHTGLGSSVDHRPAPVIDLAAPSERVWTSLAGSLTQTLALDPNGALIRSSTRSYRNNVSDSRRVHLVEALVVLSQLDDQAGGQSPLRETELREIQARFTLAGRTLGGLVDEERLPEAYLKQRLRTREMLGHNWELLRQHAEANGLYFEPLGMNGTVTQALLWIARGDVGAKRHFDPQFLGIGNPYGDERLLNWSGYTATRFFDASGRRVEAPVEGGERRELIPLALYSLDYPKVPLLLVDFRSAHAPKRGEMIRRAARDTMAGVLGISKWGNWPYFAGSFAWEFVRTRHGSATNRVARLNAYAEARQWLAFDPQLDEGLRVDLQKRLELLGVNPLEESVFDQARIAQGQYAALLKYADDPHGLGARLKHDREKELSSYRHGWAARLGLRVAHLTSLGLYKHREEPADEVIEALDRDRRTDRDLHFLKTVARSSPRPEVVWNMEEVRRAIDELAATGFERHSEKVVERILRQTSDAQTRAVAQRAIEDVDAAENQ